MTNWNKSIYARMIKGEDEYFRAIALLLFFRQLSFLEKVLNKPPWPADSKNGVGNQNFNSQSKVTGE